MRILAFMFAGFSLVAYMAQPNKQLPSSTGQCSPEPSCQTQKLLFQSTDGGESWQDLSHGLPEKADIGVAFAYDDGYFVTTRDGALYQNSHACGQNCEQVDLSGLLPAANEKPPFNRIMGIFKGKSGPYFSVAFSGLYQKVNGRSEWKPVNQAKHHDNAHFVLEMPDGVILAAHEGGIYKTTDGGQQWKRVYKSGSVFQLAVTGNTLLAYGQKGLLRSTDGGENWDCVIADEGAGPMNNIRVIEGGIVLARIANRLTPFANNSAATVSLDGGQTWDFVDAGFPSATVYDLKKSRKYLYCSHSKGISRSDNGGKTWSLVQAWEIHDEMKAIHLSVNGSNILAALVNVGC
jgi:photosystem II stability/assembly factor-like uncharacterized protein